MKKSNIPSAEKRNVIFTILVEGGLDTGFCTMLTGAQIEKIESVIERVIDDVNKSNQISIKV